MKQIFMSITLLFVFVLSCLAADLTGTWKGSVPYQGEQLEITFNLKADGEKLTGSITSSYGEIPLTDGKITGSDFSYKIDIGTGPQEGTGKYYADSIVVTSHYSGTEEIHSFKRVAE